MSRSAIFDTSILIDQIRSDKHRNRIPSVIGPIRISSVVLAELARGTVTKTDAKILRALAKNQKILTPTEKNWLESGEILGRIYAEKGFTPAKLRDLHFDVLIALTARAHGAWVITSNGSDFEGMQRQIDGGVRHLHRASVFFQHRAVPSFTDFQVWALYVDGLLIPGNLHQSKNGSVAVFRALPS